MQQFILEVGLNFIGLTHALHSGSLLSPNILRGVKCAHTLSLFIYFAQQAFSLQTHPTNERAQGHCFPKTFLPQSNNTNRLTPKY